MRHGTRRMEQGGTVGPSSSSRTDETSFVAYVGEAESVTGLGMDDGVVGDTKGLGLWMDGCHDGGW